MTDREQLIQRLGLAINGLAIHHLNPDAVLEAITILSEPRDEGRRIEGWALDMEKEDGDWTFSQEHRHDIDDRATLIIHSAAGEGGR